MPKNETASVCVYCRQSDSRFMYSVPDIFGNAWELHTCNMCRCIFLHPFPTVQQLKQAYDTSYYGTGEKKFKGVFEHVISYFRKRRAGIVANHSGKKGNALDIGCGNGDFLYQLGKKGKYNLHGIEIDGNSAKRASAYSEIQLQVKPLEENDYPEGFFDVISMFHVFEHLTSPEQTLNTIQKITKKGGTAVFSFPNIASFQARYFKGNWLHLDPPRHLFYFAPNDFVEIMKGKGFRLIKTYYASFEQNPFGFQQSLLNNWSKKREILFEAMKGNKGYLSDVSPFTLLMHKAFFYLSFPFFLLSDLFAVINKSNATIMLIFEKE